MNVMQITNAVAVIANKGVKKPQRIIKSVSDAEGIGVAGRAGYYDGIGAARDIIQNHLLQLMALTAMAERSYGGKCQSVSPAGTTSK